MITTTQNISTENKRRFIIFFVLFLLSTFGMFGQIKVATVVASNTVEVSKSATQQVALDSDVDFMNWFMGSKQTQTSNEESQQALNSSIARKKQILSSGVVTNRVLYRTFVKKVLSQESALV